MADTSTANRLNELHNKLMESDGSNLHDLVIELLDIVARQQHALMTHEERLDKLTLSLPYEGSAQQEADRNPADDYHDDEDL